MTTTSCPPAVCRASWRGLRIHPAWLVAAAAGVAVLLVAALALARPGGGHSFSGGSRGGGGGGGAEGIGLLIQLLIWLVFRHPAIGIPVVLIVIVFFIGKAALGATMKGWSTTSAAQVTAVQQVQRTMRAATIPRVQLDQLRSLDPEFSVILFEDFAYFLYAAVQRARATGFESIAAYVAPDLAKALRDPNLVDVRGIVIGAVKIVGFSGTQRPTITVELELEANLVEAFRTGGERRFYVVDRLRLERSAQARSRPPARTRILDCPNCGAPLEAVRGARCTYCQQDVGYGRFDWNVTLLRNLSKEPRGPLLASDTPEVGTELPTIVDPGAAMRLQLIQQRDPTFTWDVLSARLAHVWGELQVAWSTRDPTRIRPYVTDNLFQSMVYWIDLYLQQRCRNVNENARIIRVDLANVLTDATYDAVTVRLFATGLDYTMADDGRVLSGSRSRPRTYSEYWTLVRGTSRKGPSRGDTSCPSCGAPLKVGMAGNCEYCQVKITSGDFDWVLSRIEQDEVYAG
ncbi:MAG: TIM44-like domain-containing protein [Polyangiaceae bacterium]|nr:TIM44-like domain-containing protein [Polyangiaceae bacterium]